MYAPQICDGWVWSLNNKPYEKYSLKGTPGYLMDMAHKRTEERCWISTDNVDGSKRGSATWQAVAKESGCSGTFPGHVAYGAPPDEESETEGASAGFGREVCLQAGRGQACSATVSQSDADRSVEHAPALPRPVCCSAFPASPAGGGKEKQPAVAVCVQDEPGDDDGDAPLVPGCAVHVNPDIKHSAATQTDDWRIRGRYGCGSSEEPDPTPTWCHGFTPTASRMASSDRVLVSPNGSATALISVEGEPAAKRRAGAGKGGPRPSAMRRATPVGEGRTDVIKADETLAERRPKRIDKATAGAEDHPAHVRDAAAVGVDLQWPWP
jgi:hypothetical protein